MATYDDRDRIICLTGPECSGKTTLTHALAERLGARVVPEVARVYLEGKSSYDRGDVVEIARQQIAAERDARSRHRGLLLCDTDLLVIRIWFQEKYGAPPEVITQGLAARSRRGYLLLAPDLPWMPDPQRENPDDRDRLFDLHRETLERSAFPHRIVRGRGDTRLLRAEEALRALVGEL